MRDQQRRQLWLPHPHADAKARHPGLGDLELCLADAVAVADADLVIGESFDGEVLAELAELAVVATEELLPMPVRLELVDEHGAFLTAVAAEIALPVPVDVEPADHLRPGDRPLPHAGVHGAALPGDVRGQADVDRQQPWHAPLLP